MLTTSIIFLVLAPLCLWGGISSFLQNTAVTAYIGYAPVTAILFNPGIYWIVATAITLVLAAILLVCTLRTKKQDRFGKKLPLYVAEISTMLLSAALVAATCFNNWNTSYLYYNTQTDYTEPLALSILPIVVGGLIFAIALVVFVIQIAKDLNPKFAVKVESSRIYGFFRDYKSEMKKITWTAKKDVIRNTTVVCITLVLVGVLVALIDLGFGWVLSVIGGK